MVQRTCRLCRGLVTVIRDKKTMTMTCTSCGHREVKVFVGKGG